jgi:hypothetical protein
MIQNLNFGSAINVTPHFACHIHLLHRGQTHIGQTFISWTNHAMAMMPWTAAALYYHHQIDYSTNLITHYRISADVDDHSCRCYRKANE